MGSRTDIRKPLIEISTGKPHKILNPFKSAWLIIGAMKKGFWLRLKKKMGIQKLLCDTCKYDYDSACHNPQRPNATSCPDYKRR